MSPLNVIKVSPLFPLYSSSNAPTLPTLFLGEYTLPVKSQCTIRFFTIGCCPLLCIAYLLSSSQFNPLTAISVLTREIRERSWTRPSGCTGTSKLSADTANRYRVYKTRCNGCPDIPCKRSHRCTAMQIAYQWPKARSTSAVRSAGRSQSIGEIKLAVKGLSNVPATDIVYFV